MNSQEALISIIKQQAEIFLLDAQEFFPFGTCIGHDKEIIPIAAYIEDENDRPKSDPLIDTLESSIKRGLESGHYKIGALAFDAYIHEGGQKFDGIIVRIYQSDIIEEIQFKYYIHKDYVEFI
jgi:hypothetical protein